MGLKTLYLTQYVSAFNEDAFRGMKLAREFADGTGDLLVRHWLTDSRDEEIARNPALAADATDRAEFAAFAPDVVFLEGGLYWNGQDWRIPPDVAVTFVERGGVFIVADVERNEITQNYASYAGDLRFFGSHLEGYPQDPDQIQYVRDEQSNDGHPANLMCPWPANDGGWAKEAFDGVDQVLAMAPVALEPRGQVVLWSPPSADLLSMDYFTNNGRLTPLATAERHGLGYAVLIGAAVSFDVVTDRNPANIRWLHNLATILHERSALETQLRRGRTRASSSDSRSPNKHRTAAELAALPEGKFLEHKQTYAYDIRTRQKNPKLSDAVLDRICSFWNSEGGTLLVGIEDRTGRVVGLDSDYKLFRDGDGLVEQISHRLRHDMPAAAPLIDVRIENADGKDVMRIDVPAGDAPLFRRDCLFVRINNSTHELKGEPLHKYLGQRWPRTEP